MPDLCRACTVPSTLPMASLPPFSVLCFLPQLLLSLLGATILASSVWLFKHRSPEYPMGRSRQGRWGWCLVGVALGASMGRQSCRREVTVTHVCLGEVGAQV